MEVQKKLFLNFAKIQRKLDEFVYLRTFRHSPGAPSLALGIVYCVLITNWNTPSGVYAWGMLFYHMW